MTKKLKTLLWTSSAIVLNTAIASSLTSCSLFKKDVINDYGGYDSKYGINEAIYKRAEDDLRLLYESELKKQNIAGLISDKECASRLSNFRSNLNSFHNSLASYDNRTLSYSNRLNALKTFSKNNYSIHLDKNYFNISISEFYETLDLFVHQLYSYLKQNDCESDFIDYYLNIAQEKGKIYISNLEKKPDIDLFSELQDFQSFLTVETMSEINSKVAEYKASRALKQFFDEYTIIPRKKVVEGYTWDFLYWDPFFNTNDPSRQSNISNYINKLFIIKRNEDGQEFEYSRNMIQGFDLIPRTSEMPFDANSNTYKVKINWEINTIRPNNNKFASKFLDEGKNLNEEFSYETDVTYEYELPVSLEYEKQQLKSIYLDNIELKWDDLKNSCAKEVFFTKNNDKYVELDIHGLANAGLKINETRLQTLVPTNPSDVVMNNSITDEVPASIEQQFATNCNIFAKSEVHYDESDKIKCEFYIGFKHSFSAEDAEDLNKNHAFSIYTDGFEKLKWMILECTGMQVSSQYYLNALGAYNTCLIEINTFSNFIVMVENSNSAYYASLGIQIATSIIFGTFLAISLVQYIASFCLNFFLITQIVSMTVQLIIFELQAGAAGAAIIRMLFFSSKLKSFTEAVGIGSDFAEKYKTIPAKIDTNDKLEFLATVNKYPWEDYSTSKFIQRLVSDYDTFTTKEKFSKTIDGITPQDRMVYYSDLDNNPDYQEYLKIKEEFQADKNSIQNAFYIDSITYDEQKEGIDSDEAPLTFSTITGQIVEYCMIYDIFQYVVMMGCLYFKGAPAYIAAGTLGQIAANESHEIFRSLIFKFFGSIFMLIIFQFGVPGVIETVFSAVLPDMDGLPDFPSDDTTRGVLYQGNSDLTAYIYNDGKDENPWILYIDRKEVKDDDKKLIKWELRPVSDDEKLPSQIKIDQDGLVFWEHIDEIIQYKFYVIAIYTDKNSNEKIETKSPLITLTVQRKTIPDSK